MELLKVVRTVMKSFDVEHIGVDKNKIYKVESCPTYIFPNLKPLKQSKNSPIVIFSAPGAVGKTTLAKYFSFQKNSYYWDLSKIRLGDNTFIGSIVDNFGHTELGVILERLSNGEISFLLDGFDEAEMTTGWESIVSFVEEISKYVSDSPMSNIILFARTETAELMELSLDEINADFSVYEIEYFKEKEAFDFVKMTLDSLKDTSYLRFKVPFDNALKSIFNAISVGLDVQVDEKWDNERSKSFIGYSPVLQTIGSFLDSQNFEEVNNKYSNPGLSTGINLISEFSFDLLLREQGKVTSILKEEYPLKLENCDWKKIYAPEDQMAIIVSYLNSNLDLASIVEYITCPDWLENSLIDAVSTFLPNHPFIRKGKFASPSFRDYSLGYLLGHDIARTGCISFLNNPNIFISPLFAHYYHSEGEGECDGVTTGFIYDSLSSSLQSGETQQTTIIHNSNTNGSVEVVTLNRSGTYSTLNYSSKVRKSDKLTFGRKLHNTIIYSTNDVLLGGVGNSFELKNSEILCNRLYFNTNALVVNTYDLSETNMISKNEAIFPPTIKVSKVGDGDFHLNWKNAKRYPWSKFHDESLEVTEDNGTSMFDKIYALKLILTPFRKHSKGVFGKQGEYIEKVIIKDNKIRKEVYKKLIDAGVLTMKASSPIMELNDQKLQENGINWSDLKTLKANDNLLYFLK